MNNDTNSSSDADDDKNDTNDDKESDTNIWLKELVLKEREIISTSCN